MTTKKDSNRLKVATALVAALLLGLGAAVLLPGLSGEASSETDASSDAQGAQASGAAPTFQGVGVPGQKLEPKPANEQIPMPGCWAGLIEFDRNISMENFSVALNNAIAGGDRILATYLQERLTDLVGADTGRAIQVLEWAKQSSMPHLGIYMDALKGTQAVHSPQVLEQLLQMGEDKGATLLHRGAAMDVLEVQKRFSPATMARVKAIALDESLDSVSWLATRTIGRVMKTEYENSGQFNTYWKELLDISSKSDDLAVKLLALEMPSYFDPVLDKGSMAQLNKMMVNETERDLREMAAHRLAFTEDPNKSLEYYREAFTKEHDLCVRWALLRFAFRTAGADALPLAAQFAQQDPRLAQDYEDFKQLYADGTTDWGRIWPNKAEYHSCLVEEGAPH